MKDKLKKISDDLEAGKIFESEAKRLIMKEIFDVSSSTEDEDNNLNDFILEAMQFSKEKRKVPFTIQCPNDMEVFPSIKMKFENFGSPMAGNELEALMVTWRD